MFTWADFRRPLRLFRRRFGHKKNLRFLLKCYFWAFFENDKTMKKFQLLALSVLTAMATNAQIVINEYSSSTTTFLDENNEEADWIELYNTSASGVDLKGWCLTDNETNLTKWTFPAVTIPAKGYLLVLATGKNLTEVAAGKYLHTNFNISSDGEPIFLVDATGKIAHQTDSVPVPCNASHGLSPDGTGNWVFFANPTPGAANTTKAYATSVTTSVKFSPEGGVKTSALTVTLTTEGNTPIYYTLDCTEPTKESTKYTGPIKVDSTTVIRAITFNDNLMPGLPSTQSYIFGGRLRWIDRDKQGKPIDTETIWVEDPDTASNENNDPWGWWWQKPGHDSIISIDPAKYLDHASTFNLPVISLTTEPDNLWDYNKGILVEGPNADLNASPRRANYYNDWERPIHVELYWTDGTKRLDQDAGVKVSGAYSRMNNQKSLALHARNAYGAKYFNAKLFDELDMTQFKSFTLRDSGNDFGGTHFRDAMITHLVAGNNVDIQAYQPAVVFINGEYWGMLNMREKLNEYYIESHYPQVDHDNVDLIAASDVTKDMSASEGDMEAYNALLDFIENNDLTDDANYRYVTTQMDVDEYIEYMVSEIYGGNDDWPHNNVKVWKSKKNDGRWRWFLYDTDQSYNIWNRNEDRPEYDKLGACLVEKDGKNGKTWPNFLFRNLIKNKQFCDALANRFADRMNCEFLPSNVSHLVDSLYGNIKNEIGYHNRRWNCGTNDGNGMKDFAKKRPDNMRKHLRKHFDVGNDVKITLDANDSKAGYIEINSLTLKKFPWGGSYFKNVPVSLRAVARPGYKFVRWENDDTKETISTYAGIFISLNEKSTWLVAIFEPDNDAKYNSVVINEINYKSADDFDTKDWIELYNTTAAQINLSGWKVADDNLAEAFTIPAGTVIEPYGYLVVCSNANKFLKFNTEVSNYIGDFNFGLSKEGKIQLFDSEGSLIDVVEYAKSWGDANGNGNTLSLTDPFADNANYKLWHANDLYGTPGYQNGAFNPSHDDFTRNEFVGVEEEFVAKAFAICYPNPVSSQATLLWSQATDANVTVELFNAFGNKVALICDEWFAQGQQRVEIGGAVSACTAGVYFAKINITGQAPIIVRIIKQ